MDTKIKYGVYEEIIGDVRVQIYSNRVIRLEKRGKNGFVDAPTLCCVNRTDWDGCALRRSANKKKVSLSSDTFTLTLKADAISVADASLSDKSGDTIWEFDPKANCRANLPSPSSKEPTWCFNDSPRIIPTDFSSPVSDEEYKKHNGWGYEKNAEDYYIFICPDKKQLRADFVRLTGSCDLVPLNLMGFWYCRWHEYHDYEVLGLIDEYREKGFPIDVFVVDTDWRESTDGTGYNVSQKYFPDAKEFFDEAKKRSVSILMNDHVHKCDESILSLDQLKWFNEGVTKNLASGLDAWWYDRNWFHRFNSPFDQVHGDLMGQFFYLDIERRFKLARNDDSRTYLLSNVYFIRDGIYTTHAPHVASHRNSVQWTGDTDSSSAWLKQEVVNMVKCGVNSSIGYYSSDITGHYGDPTEPLFIRWTQYGALSAIMRYHSTKGLDRTPWKVGKAATEISREYINMRYRLAPLFYTSAYENYRDGLPIARRLDFFYPDEEKASDNSQYLLGDNILIAPLFGNYDTSFVPAAWLTHDGEEGLSGKYYNNKEMSGEPVFERVDKQIRFNWKTGSPDKSVNCDDFSAVWCGDITVGRNDVILGTISDDGIRVYIDGKLYIDHWCASNSVRVFGDEILKARSRHSIRIEYYEDKGNAVAKLIYSIPALDECRDDRKVYIPSGTWINAFTGEKIVGPKTIKVTMGLREMPIFIKAGSVNVLATPRDHLDESYFSDITLDIYAGADTADTTCHYEDDGRTNAYKQGAYRLTKYDLTCTKGGKMTLKASSETGDGKNPCSFSERNVTLRIHADKVKSIALGEKELAYSEIAKDRDAFPFAVSGGSPDSKVYTCTFSAGVDEEYTVTIK